MDLSDKWNKKKAEAERAYRNGDLKLASDLYKEALIIVNIRIGVYSTFTETLTSDVRLRIDEDVVKTQFEAAKICTNISLMYFKMWEKDFNVESATESQKFATHALEYNDTWAKGYIRSVYANIALGEFEDAMKLLEEHKTKFKETKESISLCSFIKIKQNLCAAKFLRGSKRFHLLKYPQNAFCIDVGGRGHFTSVEEFLRAPKVTTGSVSILIKPGKYDYPPGELKFGYENVDIVGDCKIRTEENILLEDPDITFTAIPDESRWVMLLSDGSYSLRRMKLGLDADNCSVYLEHCSFSTDSTLPSAFFVRGATLSCKSCRCLDSNGMKIESVNKVEIDRCYFRNAKLALYLEGDIPLPTVTRSIFEDIPYCGIMTFDAVKKLVVKDCKFRRIGYDVDHFFSHVNSAIYVCQSNALIQDTTVTDTPGTAILIHGPKIKLNRVTVHNCPDMAIAVTYTEKTSIKNCRITNCRVGVYGNNGKISFKGNIISTEKMDITALPKCQVDFLGHITHSVKMVTVAEAEQSMYAKHEVEFTNKIKNDPQINSLVKTRCQWCKRTKADADGEDFELKACGGCKFVRYCSVSCQKEDWKFHKQDCFSQFRRAEE